MWAIRRFSIAPVKSLGLQHPEQVLFEETGVPGDRLFFLVGETGKLFAGSQHGPLVQVRSSYDAGSESLSLTFPDGTVVAGDAASLGDTTVITNFYGRQVSGRLVVGSFSEALSGYIGRPVTLARVDRPGDASDVHHVTLVSAASVQELAVRGGREDLDARRFRMLIEIDGCDPHEEDTWDGRRLRVGEAVLRMLGPVPRCVVTTQSPDTGIHDFSTLKQIAGYRPLMAEDRGVPFGVYAEVEEQGRARLGDSVALVG